MLSCLNLTTHKTLEPSSGLILNPWFSPAKLLNCFHLIYIVLCSFNNIELHILPVSSCEHLKTWYQLIYCFQYINWFWTWIWTGLLLGNGTVTYDTILCPKMELRSSLILSENSLDQQLSSYLHVTVTLVGWQKLLTYCMYSKGVNDDNPTLT